MRTNNQKYMSVEEKDHLATKSSDDDELTLKDLMEVLKEIRKDMSEIKTDNKAIKKTAEAVQKAAMTAGKKAEKAHEAATATNDTVNKLKKKVEEDNTARSSWEANVTSQIEGLQKAATQPSWSSAQSANKWTRSSQQGNEGWQALVEGFDEDTLDPDIKATLAELET